MLVKYVKLVQSRTVLHVLGVGNFRGVVRRLALRSFALWLIRCVPRPTVLRDTCNSPQHGMHQCHGPLILSVHWASLVRIAAGCECRRPSRGPSPSRRPVSPLQLLLRVFVLYHSQPLQLYCLFITGKNLDREVFAIIGSDGMSLVVTPSEKHRHVLYKPRPVVPRSKLSNV